MSKIDCNLIKDLLQLYIDDVVSDATKKLIEQHMLECEECKKEFEFLQKDCVTLVDTDVISLKKIKKNILVKNTATAIFCVILTILILVNGFIFFRDSIGVSLSNIEADARSSQKIDVNYDVVSDSTDTMSAMLFYGENEKNHTFSIYVNRPSLSFGYFYRSGGGAGNIELSVFRESFQGYDDYAVLSMNKLQIAEMIVANDELSTTYKIDSTKPFAFVLPIDSGTVTFYDVDGNVVDLGYDFNSIF